MKESNNSKYIYYSVIISLLTIIAVSAIGTTGEKYTIEDVMPVIEGFALFVTIMGILGIIACMVGVMRSNDKDDLRRYMLHTIIYTIYASSRQIANAILAALGSTIHIGIFNPFS